MLKAKKPEFEPNRFRALLFGNAGSGKTHLCCSLPNTYFIDTEGVLKYKHFVSMLRDNNSAATSIYDISDIINEVKELMTVKHDYKTLVIDSITFPYALLANMEAERLCKKTPDKEGTEYGANLAKSKRLTFHLGMLLTRLDMNVIVTAHEKAKYEKNVEIGKDFDVNEKMSYALGTTMHLRLNGNSRVAFFEKSRYSELPNKGIIDFNDGYEVLKNRFGEDMFVRESSVEKFANKEQISELKKLISILNVPDETIQKWLTSAKSTSLEEMSAEQIGKCIVYLKGKINE